jgi:hypothetical protein
VGDFTPEQRYVNRLVYIFRKSRGENAAAVTRHGAGGERDHGNFHVSAIGAKAPDDAKAIEPGHVDIENHEIDWCFGCAQKRFFPAGRQNHIITGSREHDIQQFTACVAIVGYQNIFTTLCPKTRSISSSS